jgi:hypothetical protein
MNYEEKEKEYKKVVESMNKNLKPIFDKLLDKSNSSMDSISPTNWSEYVPPCGITSRNEPLTEEQIREADHIVDQVVTTIMENPDEYPEIEGQVPASEKGKAGSGRGDSDGHVPIMPLEFPEWLKDITSTLKGYFTRKKGRKGLDYEEMIKGVIRKPKEKMKRREDALYVFIDTSGSMWSYKDAYGTGLLKLFSSFFPQIAKKFSGEVWFSDYAPFDAVEPITKVIDLREFRDDSMNKVHIGGSGGTEFWGVWRYFDKKVKEAKEKSPDAKVMMIFFSDMEADFESPEYQYLIEDKDVLFVTIKGKGQEVEHLIDGKDRRLIYADVKPSED